MLNSSTTVGFIKITFSLHAKIIELEKIKVGAVSYLNTKPLLFGIKQSQQLLQRIELVEDYPANIAEMLIKNEIDVGLVPVAVVAALNEWHIVSDFCIGAEDEVASVCLFSDVPVEEIKFVLLDYESKTSVLLCKLLFKNFWKKEVVFFDAKENFENGIKNFTAAIMIGDKALKQRKKNKYVYDLAAAWKNFTGLPFVFAAWIANKNLPADFIALFNAANAEGLKHIDDVIAANYFESYDLKTYFTKNISYILNTEKIEGMNLFLQMSEGL